jgi:MSHA biogenesis protein MshP
MMRRQSGFAYIAAIVFLVVLAGFALAALRLSTTSQATVNQQVMAARANQAARGGIEWALYRLKGATSTAGCFTSPATPGTVDGTTLADFFAATGFRVTLTCTARTYNEGQNPDASNRAKNIFELTATACNGASGPCPDNGILASPDYVERKRSVSICIATDGTDCY